MNCRRAEKMIAELSRATVGSPPEPLARHIERCIACRGRLDEHARLLDALCLMPEPELTEDDWREIARGVNFGALAAGLSGARVTREQPSEPTIASPALAPFARRRLVGTLVWAALALGVGMLLGAWLFPRTRTVTVVEKVPDVRERVVEVEVPVEASVEVPVERVRRETTAPPNAGPRGPRVASPMAAARTASYRVEITPVRQEIRTWLAGETIAAPTSAYEEPPTLDEWEEDTLLPGEWDRPPDGWGLATFIVP